MRNMATTKDGKLEKALMTSADILLLHSGEK
jgi:hypothetical protein